MNKRVFISMLCLCLIFLSGLYIFKVVFPDELVMIINNPTYIAFGKYVDEHKWAYHILSSITSFLTYWLYLCAVCRQRKLSWKQLPFVLLAILSTKIVYIYAPQFGMHVSVCCMIILPALFKGSFVATCLVYSFHGLAQILSLEIRDLPMRVDVTNYAVSLVLILECYFWLLLFYIIFNYRKGDVKNG